mmetsp:Transcript_14400/g.22213  ORF Transcript_14400/g.22213 Transcript_14400/m.22213 type:complete len:211 (-) Transcript_14400:117-749(-)
MNNIIPNTCSMEQSLPNKANDRNNVVAFRATDVMLMGNAPKCLVMAAAADDPKNPVVPNNANTPNLPRTDQVIASSGTFCSISLKVPGKDKKVYPRDISPLSQAAAVMAANAMEYSRKIYSSCPTLYCRMIISDQLVMKPSQIKLTMSMMTPSGWNTAALLASACRNMARPITMATTCATSLVEYRFLLTTTPMSMVKITRELFTKVLAG